MTPVIAVILSLHELRLIAYSFSDRICPLTRSRKLSILDALVKSRETPFTVIPVKTGIQGIREVLDSRLRGSDSNAAFC
jgi:hypothetical protein